MKKEICLILFFAESIHFAKTQELRLSGALKFPITEKKTFAAECQIRSVDKVSKINTFHSELSFKQSLNQRLNISAGYRYTSGSQNKEYITNDDSNDKSRFNLDIEYDIPFLKNPADCEYRLRFQVSSKDRDKQKYYLRNRIRYKYKIQKGFRLYVSEEVYLDAKNRSFKFNKIQIGAETKISKSIELDFYFINELELKKKKNIYFNYIMGVTITKIL